jgi:hypothetical protein
VISFGKNLFFAIAELCEIWLPTSVLSYFWPVLCSSRESFDTLKCISCSLWEGNARQPDFSLSRSKCRPNSIRRLPRSLARLRKGEMNYNLRFSARKIFPGSSSRKGRKFFEWFAAIVEFLKWNVCRIGSKIELTCFLSEKISVSCKKNGLNTSHWSCWKACCKGYTFCFTTYLVRPSTGVQLSHEQDPKKRSNDLERSKFCQQVQSFVYEPPWRRVTFKFWEIVKNASEVTLVPKNIFLQILNFVQSFVECKVSLADGSLLHSSTDANLYFPLATYLWAQTIQQSKIARPPADATNLSNFYWTSRKWTWTLAVSVVSASSCLWSHSEQMKSWRLQRRNFETI